jgi:hypothetical protein
MAVTDHSQNADLDATDYHNHITNTRVILNVLRSVAIYRVMPVIWLYTR